MVPGSLWIKEGVSDIISFQLKTLKKLNRAKEQEPLPVRANQNKKHRLRSNPDSTPVCLPRWSLSLCICFHRVVQTCLLGGEDWEKPVTRWIWLGRRKRKQVCHSIFHQASHSRDFTSDTHLPSCFLHPYRLSYWYSSNSAVWRWRLPPYQQGIAKAHGQHWLSRISQSSQ